MIICIYGKSGSGKSFLANKLYKQLPNSVHLDLDKLNKDLMKLPDILEDAKIIFKDKDIISCNKLDSEKILRAIMADVNLYNDWTNYMTNKCNNFVENFISSTTFDYYIIDHLRANLLDACKKHAYIIECVSEFDTRFKRLKQRDKNISEDTLRFRDINFAPTTADIIYHDDNYNEILQEIQKNIQ